MSTNPQGARNLALVVYILQAVGFFNGLTFLVALVINYAKRDTAAGTWVDSHFSWQIRTFWWGLVWNVIGIATVWILIGWAILFCVNLWLIYRVARGWLALVANESMPAP